MKKRLLGWFVWISVKHLPPTPWQLSSDFQAEFEEKIIRETHYPINRNIFFCAMWQRKQSISFICKHLKEIHSGGLGANHTVEKARKDKEKEASQCLLETKLVFTQHCNATLSRRGARGYGYSDTLSSGVVVFVFVTVKGYQILVRKISLTFTRQIF